MFRFRVFEAAVLYFAIVFGVGFALGVIRVLWLLPWLGERGAELVEAPFMGLTIWLGARFVVDRFEIPTRVGARLPVGILALALVVFCELFVVLRLREMTLAEYVRERDPVSGMVYLSLLAIYALMPSWIGARRPST